MPAFGRPCGEPVDHGQVLRAEQLLDAVAGVGRKACPRGRRFAAAVLAREDAARQGKIGNEGELLAPALGQDVCLGLPVQQAVLVLHADEPRRSGRRGRLGIAQLLGGEVRAADLANLARLHQLVEGAQRVRDRSVGIRLVQLVQVDAVGAQPAEAVLRGAMDVAGAGALALVVHRHPELGRDQDVVASRAEGPAQELLADGAPVDIGRVEEGDPGVQSGMDDRMGPRLVGDALPEVVAAQPDHRHSQRSDRPCLHLPLLRPLQPVVSPAGGESAVTSVSPGSAPGVAGAGCPGTKKPW